MQLKKLLQGSAFALVAAACAIAVPSVAKAAGEPTGTFAEAGLASANPIDWDSTKAELTITADNSKAKEVMVGFAKVDKNKNVKVTSWDVYDGTTTETKAKVDLSKLNNTKDNYIAITTPGNSVAVIKIPKTATVTKAKFNALTGTLQVGSGDNGGAATPADLVYSSSNTGDNASKNTATLYEYRTAYSGWQDFTEGTGTLSLKDMKFYQEEGAKLFVRLKADPKPASNFLSAQGSEELKYGEQQVKVYDGLKLAGKEAKVTIPAKAKGPKVTADYVKGTVKFPKGSEYRYVTSTGIVVKTAAQAASGNTPAKEAEMFPAADPKSPTDLLKEAKGSGTTDVTEANLEVRTKATAKKPASKWTSFKLEAPRALLAYSNNAVVENDSFIGGTNRAKFSGTGRDGATGTDAATAIGDKSALKSPAESTGSDYEGKGVAGVKAATLTETIDANTKKPSKADGTNVLTIDYVAVGKVKEQYFTANALKIKNSGKLTYEIVVGDKPEASKKGTKVASTKEVTIKNVKDAQKVWIRVAGDKKSQVWTSDYAELGVVDFPYKIPKKAAESQS